MEAMIQFKSSKFKSCSGISITGAIFTYYKQKNKFVCFIISYFLSERITSDGVWAVPGVAPFHPVSTHVSVKAVSAAISGSTAVISA
jgi:hypothetical protein